MTRHWYETDFFHDLVRGIEGPRKGGAKIIIDAENAATGVGKTSLAVSLAERLAELFDYDLQPEDMTLSGKHYLRRWKEHPDREQPSVIILDELAGAGAGNARRSMSNQNVALGSAWQMMRKKRIITIVTLPHWSKADKWMRQQADYRLWCLAKPIGFYRAYRVGATFSEGNVALHRFKDVQRIPFRNLDAEGNEFYDHLTRKKDELLQSEFMDADELLEEAKEQRKDPEEAKREEKIRIAQNLRASDMTLKEVGAAVGMSDSWVAKYTDRPQEASAD